MAVFEFAVGAPIWWSLAALGVLLVFWVVMTLVEFVIEDSKRSRHKRIALGLYCIPWGAFALLSVLFGLFHLAGLIGSFVAIVGGFEGINSDARDSIGYVIAIFLAVPFLSEARARSPLVILRRLGKEENRAE